jgi:hypothetical protein
MNDLGDTDPPARRLDTSQVRHLVGKLRNRAGRGGNRRVAVLAAVSVVLAIAVGIGWGLSGADDPDTPPGPAADDTGPGGLDLPGSSSEPTGQASEAPAGTGSGTGSGSGSGSGSGAGNSGGGPSANQPPRIEDPGLSSDGLLLAIQPTVSDPDGDDVSLLFEVDGEAVPPADPTRAEVRFDLDEVDYQHEASVTITATDSLGATTSETFTHALAAISTVRVTDISFKVDQPAVCFADEPTRTLRVTLQLSGHVTDSRDSTRALSRNRPEVTLLGEASAEVVGERPSQQIRLSDLEFAGMSDGGFVRTYRSQSLRTEELRPFSGGCSGAFHYTVSIKVR